MTKSTSFRLPDPTNAQIEYLAGLLDTDKTAIVVMAIRDMYREETETMTTAKKPFKATEVDAYATGWIVDLSPAGVVNPDFYWKFKTKRQAKQFAELVAQGTPAEEAAYIVDDNPYK